MNLHNRASLFAFAAPADFVRSAPVSVLAAVVLVACSPTSDHEEDPSEVAAVAQQGLSCSGKGKCNDGNACTWGDRCKSGVCTGTPYSCDDGDSCTVDSCDGAGGCAHQAYSCDDFNACTADACDGAGGCTHWSTATPEDCGNGVDDDCDGYTDGADHTCGGCVPAETDCFDYLDDDCDGMSDWKDVECGILECGCDEGYFCYGHWYPNPPEPYCQPRCNTFWTSTACGYFCPDACPVGEFCFDDNDCASGDCTANACR